MAPAAYGPLLGRLALALDYGRTFTHIESAADWSSALGMVWIAKAIKEELPHSLELTATFTTTSRG